jgi:excisionase family DNA binding protein
MALSVCDHRGAWRLGRLERARATMGREREHMWVSEAADRLKVSDTTVRDWFDSGKLDGFKVDGSGYRRITTESVEALYRKMHGGTE